MSTGMPISSDKIKLGAMSDTFFSLNWNRKYINDSLPFFPTKPNVLCFTYSILFMSSAYEFSKNIPIFLTDRYKRHSFHLWWRIHWFGEDYFWEVIFIFWITFSNCIRNYDSCELWWFTKGLLTRRQDSSIGFGAPVRANMRTGGMTNATITSSLLESVRVII